MISDNKNSYWSAIQHSTTLALSLIGLKVNLLSFNSELFGIWVLLLSIWGFGSVLDLGFGISTIRFIALSRDNPQHQSKVISTSLFIYQILGLLIIVICTLLANNFYFSNPKIIPPEYLSLSKNTFYILSIGFYFQYISTVFRSTIEGCNNYILSSKILILVTTLNFLFTVLVYVLHLNLQHLALFYLVTNVFQCIVSYLVVLKNYPKIKIHFFAIEFETLKAILKFSTSIQVTYVIGAMMDPVIKYLTGLYSTSSTITTYEIARKFSFSVFSLFSVTFRNALPLASVLKTKQDYIGFINTKSASITKFGIFYAGIFYGVLSLFFAGIFKYLYNNENSLFLFYILALAETVNIYGYSTYLFLMALGKALSLTILQILNLVLTSVFLIAGYSVANSGIGLTGYFFSVILGNIYMLFLMKKHTGINLSPFFKKIQIWKLFFILTVFIINILLYAYKPEMIYTSQIIVSTLCVIIFIKDIRIFFNKIIVYINSQPFFLNR